MIISLKLRLFFIKLRKHFFRENQKKLHSFIILYSNNNVNPITALSTSLFWGDFFRCFCPVLFKIRLLHDCCGDDLTYVPTEINLVRCTGLGNIVSSPTITPHKRAKFFTSPKARPSQRKRKKLYLSENKLYENCGAKIHRMLCRWRFQS